MGKYLFIAVSIPWCIPIFFSRFGILQCPCRVGYKCKTPVPVSLLQKFPSYACPWFFYSITHTVVHHSCYFHICRIVSQIIIKFGLVPNINYVPILQFETSKLKRVILILITTPQNLWLPYVYTLYETKKIDTINCYQSQLVKGINQQSTQLRIMHGIK